MGLDMYLFRTTHLRLPNSTSVKELNSAHIKGERITRIVEEMAYWRKANHIHNWFVKNVQDGEDDCNEYYVTNDHIKALNEACKKVLDDNSLAKELLPTASGFFFGGVEYDKYYFHWVSHTLEVTNTLLEEMGNYNSFSVDIVYQASW
jgi:hypothetical protein